MYKLHLDQRIKNQKKYIVYVFSTILVLVATSLMALNTDVEKPVHIQADSVLFDKSKGRAIYEGNVSITQGSLEIKARKIEINAPNSEISKITANGSPVSFKQKMDDGKFAKGSANYLLYFVKTKKLLLTGKAQLSQGNDKFSSNRIEYSTKSGELKAGGNNKDKQKGRVNAIFYPTNKAK